jgi:hypothetical protein
MQEWIIQFLVQHGGWVWSFAIPGIPSHSVASLHHVVNVAQQICS